jgi:hypothetical protein
MITKKGYICRCGYEAVSSSFLPLTASVAYVSGQSRVTLMNVPVACDNCGGIIILPEKLVLQIENVIRSLIKDAVLVSVKYAEYRPPLAKIADMLDDELKPLIKLEDDNIIFESVDYSGIFINKEYIRTQYISYVKSLMYSSIKRENYETTYNPVSFHGVLANIYMDPSYDYDTESAAFLRTVIYYLQELGCFCLTEECAAFTSVCKILDLNRYRFPDDYAVNWIKDNMWALAGLNILYDYSMFLTDVPILPQYQKVLDELCALRAIASIRPGYLEDRSPYHKIITADDTSKYTSFLKKYVKKLPNYNFIRVVDSPVLDYYTSARVYSIECLTNPYKLAEEFLVTELPLSEEAAEVVSRIRATGYTEYVGKSPCEVRELMLTPTPHIDDMEKLWKYLGCIWFMSPLSNSNLMLRSKVLQLVSTQDYSNIVKFFGSSPKINQYPHVIESKSSDSERVRLVRDNLYLIIDDLPEHYLHLREDLNTMDFLALVHENEEQIIEDGALWDKYGDVFT